MMDDIEFNNINEVISFVEFWFPSCALTHGDVSFETYKAVVGSYYSQTEEPRMTTDFEDFVHSHPQLKLETRSHVLVSGRFMFNFKIELLKNV